MQLWNTRTQRKETFSADQLVRMYVCGITPYATTHLGHARTYVVFDVLIRELERLGHTVRYVQNVTDVDDPLFEKAQSLGISTQELAADCTRIFLHDMSALGVRPPDVYPHASQEIEEMQRVIARLLERGHAYTQGDRVYYRIRSFDRYGHLSRLDREEMVAIARERGEDPTDPRKEDPLDFLLWKPSQPGEDSWSSPWGRGRPGWHIECSAMALRYLGPQLDIHGGGSDLIYPHHEHEAAQSEACTDRAPFSRFWMHVEMVELGGVKMSKSLGNMVMVRELLPRVGPLAVRHYLLSTHYRSPLDYSEDDLKNSVEQVERLGRALQRSNATPDEAVIARQQHRLNAAMADDLDTPTALNALDEAAQIVLDAPTGVGNPWAARTLHDMASRLGLAARLQAGVSSSS